MKFMVVIILDDREPELACKVQQPKPALGPQRNGGRELVVRRHEHRAHRIAAAGPLDRFDVDPVLVEVDGNDIGAERPESGHRRLISQFLDDHRIALADQNLRGEEDAVLAAARSDEHTSELQSLMSISYAVFCLKKKKT